jgi:hypothetical protein
MTPQERKNFESIRDNVHGEQAQRKSLTLNQLREHWQVAKVLDMTHAEIDFADYVLIARDVEALHGITGEQK